MVSQLLFGAFILPGVLSIQSACGSNPFVGLGIVRHMKYPIKVNKSEINVFSIIVCIIVCYKSLCRALEFYSESFISYVDNV